MWIFVAGELIEIYVGVTMAGVVSLVLQTCINRNDSISSNVVSSPLPFLLFYLLGPDGYFAGLFCHCGALWLRAESDLDVYT